MGDDAADTGCHGPAGGRGGPAVTGSPPRRTDPRPTYMVRRRQKRTGSASPARPGADQACMALTVIPPESRRQQLIGTEQGPA